MRLDEFIPLYEFNEVHARHVEAPPERVFDATRKVTPREILFFQTFTAIRRFGGRGGEGILNAPPDEPLLDVATRTGFEWLAIDPPRELVVGMHITRETFAVMNFLITPHDRGGSDVRTETRIHASTRRARFLFRLYWLVIHPGSAILRRTWLRAIDKRATASP